MASFYNLDEIKSELNKKIATAQAQFDAWKKVIFPTKKDGKPFAIMSKNINGAIYCQNKISMQPGENVLCITAFCDGVGYVDDEINCYELVKYLTDDEKKAKTENYMPKQSYLEQIYKYDIEDIKNAVDNRINYLYDRILSLKAQLNIVDKVYHNFRACYEKALQELERDCESARNVGFSNNRNDIYYMILDTIKDRFPYC